MPTSPAPLATLVGDLWGVGSERAAQLARLKIFTVDDLLLHRPRRHEDRRHLRSIRELEMGAPATVRGRVVALGVKYWRKRTRSVFELVLDDGSARLHCRWWNLPFLEKYFQVGDEVFVYGKPVLLKPRTMDHPETETIEAGEDSSIHINRITPVYPLTEGVPQRWLRGLMWRTLERYGRDVVDPWPRALLVDLPARAAALRQLHFPAEAADVEVARQRLALDELIGLQTNLQRRRRQLLARARGLPCAGDNSLIKPFLARLGFKLTAAQTRVLRELRHDLGAGAPMRRLLQGDVGSGKTAVAACCALMAIESGWNVALMAPTEILAGQHHDNFVRWFEPLGVPVALRTASHKSGGIPAGAGARPGLFIGTHALLEESFSPERLGLVVIDEQHKFGVTQREELVRKGRYPHLLVMTATPIPRTLGLTLYGDLDLSVIDELPAGRGRVRTFLRGVEQLPKVHEFIHRKLAEGRQAYIVYPRVEEGDLRSGLKAVIAEAEKLTQILAPHRVGLLHGRLSAAAKDEVMTEFRAGRVHALVATSIIEVGVDVPNATVMLIENAGQFGLAQLHQLRGRIGRGSAESYCILVGDLKTAEARERLRVMEETTDGFRIADADLRLRGPGELLGQSQSGLPSFRFADLATDLALVERAREIAARM